jgi:hypothetical protein
MDEMNEGEKKPWATFSSLFLLGSNFPREKGIK